MILLVGVLLGLIAGSARAWLGKRSYTLPEIQRTELALLAFLPQALVFFVPQTSQIVSPQWATLILPLSLGILVIFAWFNRHLQGFWLLGLGLLLNFAVIAANGGLMPISPETIAIVHGTQVPEIVESQSIGSKNVILRVEDTRLEWLGDRFTVPDQLPIQFAYSLGDLFLAVGAFWALWAGGAKPQPAPRTNLATQHYSSQSQRGV